MKYRLTIADLNATDEDEIPLDKLYDKSD